MCNKGILNTVNSPKLCLLLVHTKQIESMDNLNLGPKFNGWSNWETWNIALWLDNDYSNYQIALESDSFFHYVLKLMKCGESMTTPDGANFFDYKVNIQELDEKIQELRD